MTAIPFGVEQEAGSPAFALSIKRVVDERIYLCLGDIRIDGEIPRTVEIEVRISPFERALGEVMLVRIADFFDQIPVFFL